MAENSAFFSIWAQDSPYWLVIEGAAANRLPGMKLIHHKHDLCAVKTSADWSSQWTVLAEKIRALAPDGIGHRTALIAAEELPGLQEITMSLRPFAELDGIARNLWLIEDVNKGRLGCYMQRVIDRRGKQVGYEAFARMESADGGVIGGGAIMQAATALRVEYQLDRLLHKQAIQSFIESDLDGYIFINFLTGFIHRPEVYLEGLSQAVTRFDMRPASVVLDVPVTDYAHDIAKLKTIALYCRARGFALALDDVNSTDQLEALVSEVRPAFVKLDGKFGTGMNDMKRQASLRDIVRISHAAGVSVLAEGVETEAMHDAYLAADVDMFQGYLFGAPERFPREEKPARRKQQ